MARALDSGTADSTRRAPTTSGSIGLLLVAVAVIVSGWRIVESEIATAERSVRERWRAEATRGIVVVGDAILAAEQVARERRPEAWLLENGVFVRPVAPRALRALATIRGRDAEGDFLLDEAERLLASPEALPRARDLLLAAQAETRDEDVRRVAALRLFGVQRRLGDETAAIETAQALLDRGSETERAELRELLMLRCEIDPKSESLRSDLLTAIGGPDEEFARACLDRCGTVDSAAIAARTRDVARMNDLARWTEATRDLASGRALARVTGGEVEVQVRLDDSLRAFAAASIGSDPRWTSAHAIVRSEDAPREWSERAAIGDRLPGYAVELLGDHSEIVDSVRTRVGIALLALLAVVGSIGFALRQAWRAVARERELAARQTAFVARVGHDLRTPLALIRMYAETIATGRVSDAGQTREFAGIAVRESERLTRLVGTVLDFSRLSENGAPRPYERIEMKAFVEAIVEAHRPLLERSGMRVTVEGDSAVVRGDREALSSLVGNLVENGMHHAASGGALSIVVTPEGTRVRLAFQDRGPGMSPELTARAFDRFVRGEGATSRGTGLGLALVKEIAQAHGGDASVANREGGGLIVTVELPTADVEGVV